METAESGERRQSGDPVAATSSGAQRIAAERKRQVEVEGWTDEHDDEHDAGEMARAARLYLQAAVYAADGPRSSAAVWRYYERQGMPEDEDFRRMVENPARHAYGWDEAPNDWPWDRSWWKPSPDPIRNLVKAGALIAAEIDRLQRGHNGGDARG